MILCLILSFSLAFFNFFPLYNTSIIFFGFKQPVTVFHLEMWGNGRREGVKILPKSVILYLNSPICKSITQPLFSVAKKGVSKMSVNCPQGEGRNGQIGVSWYMGDPSVHKCFVFLIDDVTRRRMVNLWDASENERENRGFLQVIIIIRNCPTCTTKVSWNCIVMVFVNDFCSYFPCFRFHTQLVVLLVWR